MFVFFEVGFSHKNITVVYSLRVHPGKQLKDS